MAEQKMEESFERMAKERGLVVGRWIFVSEGLPEEHGRYLVTVKYGDVMTALWAGDAENWKDVIAWMSLPLPAPYESKESEDER